MIPKDELKKIAKNFAESILMAGGMPNMTVLIPRKSENVVLAVHCLFENDRQKSLAMNGVAAMLALEEAPYYALYAEVAVVKSNDATMEIDRERYPSLQDHPDAQDALMLATQERAGSLEVEMFDITRTDGVTTLSNAWTDACATGKLANLYGDHQVTESNRKEVAAIINLALAIPNGPLHITGIKYDPTPTPSKATAHTGSAGAPRPH